MKRVISAIVSGVLAMSLAACGVNAASSDATANTSSEIAANATSEEAVDVSSEAETASSSQAESAGRTLIVYFSPANSDTVDSITSATARVGEVSVLEYLAQTIGDRVDADIAKIVPETAYSIVYDEIADYAKAERDNDERPAFSLDVNPEDYDTIFVGYPIWWYGFPMVMETFFDTYDFSGKTIVPFNTHLGSGDSGTHAEMAELEPNAVVLDGIAISANDVEDAGADVVDWLAGIGYLHSELD